jgi:hypothetical protein
MGDISVANARSLIVISHSDFLTNTKKDCEAYKNDYHDIPRMNNDARVFIVRLFHYKKKITFLKMRMSVVLENGVMMKAVERKWAKVYSSVAGGRSAGLHAIWQSAGLSNKLSPLGR